MRIGATAAGVAVAGAGLAVLGPFGTFGDLTTGERFGYWIGLTLLMWAQTEAVFAALRRWTRFLAMPLAAQAGLAALAGAVPTTFEVAYAEGLLRVRGVLTPASMVETYGKVAVVALGLFVPLALLTRGRRAGPPVEATGFAKRLPQSLSGRIVALAAEDHYLRVFTETGDALIHHRFSDAVRELAGLGVQTHRSWWVARDTVVKVEREGDRHVLVLTGGVRAPVSRTHLAAVRQAGLVPARD